MTQLRLVPLLDEYNVRAAQVCRDRIDNAPVSLVPRSAAPVKLNAYRCGGQTTGSVDGDLVGFLRALSLNVS